MSEDQPAPPEPGSPLLPGSTIPPAAQAHLRRSLEVLRDEAQDPVVRRRIDDVLAGRGSLRELARDGGFGAFMEPLVRRGLQRIDEMSPEERAAAEEGARALGRGEPPASHEPGPTPRPPDPGTW